MVCRIFAWITLSFVIMHVSQAINVQVYYDQVFTNDIKPLQKTSTIVSFSSSALHQQSILFISSNTTTMSDLLVSNDFIFSKDVVTFSFTNHDRLMLTTKGSKLFFGFSTSFHDLQSKLHENLYEECIRQSKMYYQTIVFLIYSLSVNGVSIISDSHPCSFNFANKIYGRLSADEQSKDIILSLKHFSLQSYEDYVNLSEFLYTARTIDTPVVVLLTHRKYYSMIFQLATKYGLTGTFQTWIIPNYNDETFTRYEPTKILTFHKYADSLSVIKTHHYASLTESIPLLVSTYQQTQLEQRTSNDDIFLKLYQVLRDKEDENVIEAETIVSYINHAEKNSHWISVEAIVRQREFILRQDEIPILRSVYEFDIHRHVSAVAVFDEPFNMEASEFYNPKERSCGRGLLCKKPINQVYSNSSLVYQETCCTGFLIDVFDLIKKDLNLNVEIYIAEDGKYGAIQGGTWNGIVGELAKNKFDVAIAGLTITKQRLEVIDFTVPYISDKMGILVKPEVAQLNFINWEFIAPLSKELKYVFFACVIVMIFSNYFYENTLYAYAYLNDCTPQLKYYSFFESMSYIIGVTLQRDLGGKNPIRSSARVSAVVFAFGMVIVVTTYTAVLAAQSVQNHEKDPFKGSQDQRLRNPTDEFRFGILKSSSYEDFFKNGETEILRKMHYFMQDYNFDSTTDAVERVKNGVGVDNIRISDPITSNKNDSKIIIAYVMEPVDVASLYIMIPKNVHLVESPGTMSNSHGKAGSACIMIQNRSRTLEAVISDYSVLHYYLSKDRSCLLRLERDILLSFGLGFGLRKDYPWKILMDQSLLKHNEMEIITSLRKKWFTNICQPSIFINTQNQLSINTFGGIILILAVTAVVTAFFLYLESVYEERFKNKCWKRINKNKVILKINDEKFEHNLNQMNFIENENK